MANTKIVVIGAGSASFGLGVLRDAMRCSDLRGSTLCLVDIDAEALETTSRLARLMNDRAGAGLKLESTTERAHALPGAEFVIISIAIRRNELWRLDWEIPLKHGIKHVFGENGGPGGLSHTLRNVPVVLDICRDIRKLCPEALVLNFSNPESRLCMAMIRYGGVKAVGLCHGVPGQARRLAEILGVPPEDADVKAGGLNHFTWFMDFRNKKTGEDLYPILRERVKDDPSSFQPLARELFRIFGLYPSPSDDHYGEFLSWAWERAGLEGYPFDKAEEGRVKLAARIQRLIAGEEPVGPLLEGGSGESAIDIIASMLTDRNLLLSAVNIPNEGCITNLPDDAIVEVPAVVSSMGVHGMHLGPLPMGIAALCRQQVAVQELAVAAAALGSRELAFQAMMADSVVTSLEAGENCLDELLRVHAPYLPQFGKSS